MIVSVTITDSRETVIIDAIRSVVKHVDRVLIVDTGITDETVKRVEEVAGDKLKVVGHTWVDFSAARNCGLRQAEALGADWIVIVDSDERLNFGALDLRRVLSKTSTNVFSIEADDGTYSKPKIIRARSRARFVGPTHEALIGTLAEPLRGATFRELPKTVDELRRKFERDVALLTAHIVKQPNDPRWQHYLGVSYEGLGQRALAADAFGRCVELRKSGVEAAWCAFKQAEQLYELGRCAEAVHAAVRGLEADVTFGECAWIAAAATLKTGDNDRAVAWARVAEAVGRYKGCGAERLYFQHVPALYELPYEILRSALPNATRRAEANRDFHAAKLARVRAGARGEEHDLDRMGIVRSVPDSARFDARSMLRPMTLSSRCPSARAVRIKFDPPDGMLPMNPSICRHNGAMWCVVRAVNYSMSGRQYVVHDPNGVVRSKNYLGKLAADGTFTDVRPMNDLDQSPRFRSHVRGYEDVRLVSLTKGKRPVLAASATVCDRDQDGRRLIARLTLDTAGNVKRADVQPSNQLCEKNWLPLSVDGELTYIYSLDPTAILPGPLYDCPFALDHLRGGAAVAFKRGYLCVMHEVIDLPEERVYLHRFVRLDGKFHVVAVSPAWTFAHYGIEFCAGMAIDKGDVVLSYGLSDREAWTVRVKTKDVEALAWIEPESNR